MRWILDVEKRARRQLDAIRGTDLRRVQTALFSLGHEPRQPGVKRLRDSRTHRLRTGDWRILFDIDDESRIVIVTDIVRRNERTYRDI